MTEIETRSNQRKHHPAATQFRFFTIFSGLAEALTPTNYTIRVQESWRAAELIGVQVGRGGDGQRLGDFDTADFLRVEHALDEVSRKRARHFFTETDRVRSSVNAWRNGEKTKLGNLMAESASSSMDNYESGATPVKDLVNLINEVSGVAGARFCGPGFRGCCLGLLETGADLDKVAVVVVQKYAIKYPPLAEKVWVRECVISDGARLV